MSRKKKKSIWRSTFYRVYFALVALAFVVAISFCIRTDSGDFMYANF